MGSSKLQNGSTGLVRLSKNADSKGNGPNSLVYSAIPVPPTGTLLIQIQFTVATGNDDLGGSAHGSSATATVFVSSGHSFTGIPVPPVGATGRLTQSLQPFQPLTTRAAPSHPPRRRAASGVQINLVQNNPNLAADNWDIFALEVSLLNDDSSVQVPQIFLLGTNTLQDGSVGLVRLCQARCAIDGIE
jgi:hypothetical protein